MNPTPNSVLEFAAAGKKFGDTWVMQDMSLSIEAGEILGLIGPSGSGKTTAMRLANGVYRPDAGDVRLMGHEPSKMRAADRSMIGYLPQSPVLFDDLTLWANLQFHASLNGVKFRRRKWLNEALELVELEDHRDKLVREASGGMKRRLALAATLVHAPRILMLDEPTAGIDPILRSRIWERFQELANEGRTLIVTTQYVGEAANCKHIGLLAESRVIAFGSPEHLRQKAAGGEVIEIEADQPLRSGHVEEIAHSTGATEFELKRADCLRLTVPDAGTVMSAALDEVTARGYVVVHSGEIVMSYDEMFVELVQRARAEAARQPVGAEHNG